MRERTPAFITEAVQVDALRVGHHAEAAQARHQERELPRGKGKDTNGMCGRARA